MSQNQKFASWQQLSVKQPKPITVKETLPKVEEKVTEELTVIETEPVVEEKVTEELPTTTFKKKGKINE
jgi:hypothetical protein